MFWFADRVAVQGKRAAEKTHAAIFSIECSDGVCLGSLFGDGFWSDKKKLLDGNL